MITYAWITVGSSPAKNTLAGSQACTRPATSARNAAPRHGTQRVHSASSASSASKASGSQSRGPVVKKPQSCSHETCVR